MLIVVGLIFGLTAEAQKIVQRYAFEGTLAGKTPVRLAFEVNAEKIAAGAIYYPNAKNPAQILIVGSTLEPNSFHFREFQDNGYVTGSMSFQIKNGRLTGTWTNPKTGKQLAFTGSVENWCLKAPTISARNTNTRSTTRTTRLIWEARSVSRRLERIVSASM